MPPRIEATVGSREMQGTSSVPVKHITVVGAGTMGRGIAHVAALAGYQVAIHDVSLPLLEKAVRLIGDDLERAVAKGKVDGAARDAALARIRTAPALEDAVRGSDLAIEAVPESLDLKRDVFRRLDAGAPPATVLATNTSSLPVAAIAAVTTRPDRVVGMHFFNPVPVMALLEVVRGAETAEDTVACAMDVGRAMGKEPILVRDSPGFASSRLGVVLGLEAIRMLEAGVASAEDIDKAMTLGYRHPMGPLRLTDLVGLDVRLAIAEHLHRELRSEAFRPPDLMRRMVAEGKLGKKTGQGFYRWDV